IAQELFGRSGAQLIQFLDQGASGLAKLRAEADQYGATVGGAAAAASKELSDDLVRLHTAVSSVETTFVNNLVPALDDSVKAITGFITQAQIGPGLIDGLAGAVKRASAEFLTLGGLLTHDLDYISAFVFDAKTLGDAAAG